MTAPAPDNLLDRLLEQEGRQLLEARMLPNDGPLTDEQRIEVRAALKAYLAKHEIRHKDVARQIGDIKTSTVHQLINDKYKASTATQDDHLRSLNSWMEGDARRRRTKPDDRFVETHVAKLMLNAARMASEMRTMALVYGPSGVGKTMVAHVIAERFTGAILLRISRGNSSYTALRSILFTRLRLRGRRVKSDRPAGLTMDERIFEALRDSHRMIVVDEAHRISPSGLEFLRDIHDECGVPILLLCTKDLLDRIRAENDEEHGQLYSRFNFVCDLTRGRDKMPGGKAPLFTLSEIRKLFESDKVRLVPDAQAYLMDVANMLGHGSLRRCRGILRWAIGIERMLKGLSPEERVTLTAAVLERAETEPRADRSMLADIAARRPPAVAAAG